MQAACLEVSPECEVATSSGSRRRTLQDVIQLTVVRSLSDSTGLTEAVPTASGVQVLATSLDAIKAEMQVNAQLLPPCAPAKQASSLPR